MSAIHDRWHEQKCSPLRPILLSAIGCPSPFGQTEDGLCDFRGARINDSLHQLEIERIDFSNGLMGRGQLIATVRECRFVGFTCDGTLGNHFTKCSFQKANLSGAVIYGRFYECDFRSAKFRGVRASQVRFENCVLDAANLQNASFYDSAFVSCSFIDCRTGSGLLAGSLAGSIFEKCTIERTDFSHMVLTRANGLVSEKLQPDD